MHSEPSAAEIAPAAVPCAAQKPRIVCVDDEPLILETLQRLLHARCADWEVTCFSDSVAAWESLRKGTADVIVVDVQMPNLTGTELLQRLRRNENTQGTPVIVLTGLDDSSLKRQVLDLGATDLLNKPIQTEDLLARLRSALRLKICEDALKHQNDRLEHMVVERTRQLQASRIEIIWRLAKAAEFRDEQTGNHVLRVAHYSRLIAEALHKSRTFVETLFLSAPLHDIGKIGIPDCILHKPGKLSDEERRIVQTHCEIGERILGEPRNPQRVLLFNRGSCPDGFPLVSQDPVLRMAREIAASHHERWDGGGYPKGLAGEQIPISARIVAVADVYDALTSERPYKPAFDPAESLKVIRQGAARHFDPSASVAFSQVWDQVEAIRLHLQDSERPDVGTAWIEFGDELDHSRLFAVVGEPAP